MVYKSSRNCTTNSTLCVRKERPSQGLSLRIGGILGEKADEHPTVSAHESSREDFHGH